MVESIEDATSALVSIAVLLHLIVQGLHPRLHLLDLRRDLVGVKVVGLVLDGDDALHGLAEVCHCGFERIGKQEKSSGAAASIAAMLAVILATASASAGMLSTLVSSWARILTTRIIINCEFSFMASFTRDSSDPAWTFRPMPWWPRRGLAPARGQFGRARRSAPHRPTAFARSHRTGLIARLERRGTLDVRSLGQPAD